MEHEKLTHRIIGRAMLVKHALGPGFLESVYQNALGVEPRAAGLSVQCRVRARGRYRDVVVGNFFADMLVEDCVLVEIKAVRALTPAHEAQLVNYPSATGIEVGLLLNFGGDRLEFRRKTRVYRPGKHQRSVIRQDEQGKA